MLRQKIIILGKAASGIAKTLIQDQPDCPFIIADTIADARDWMDGQVGEILLISRDMVDINEPDIIQISTDNHQTIIWPPDHLLGPLIRHLARNMPDVSEDEAVIDKFIQSSEVLIRKNHELTTRITALEGVVRSLLSALSQYDPAAEAYIGEKDAWELIMNGLPAAGLAPEEYSDEEYDDTEEYEEEGT